MKRSKWYEKFSVKFTIVGMLLSAPLYFIIIEIKNNLYDNQISNCTFSGYIYDNAGLYASIGLENVDQAPQFLDYYNKLLNDSIKGKNFTFCNIPLNAKACIKDSLYIENEKIYHITYFIEKEKYYNNCYITEISFHKLPISDSTILKFEKKWNTSFDR